MSVGVNGFIGSGFICICSVELCGARIGGHCGWPQCWDQLQFKMGSSFVTTPFIPGKVAAGSSPVGSLITPYVRGVFRGGWEGWLCGD